MKPFLEDMLIAFVFVSVIVLLIYLGIQAAVSL